MVASIGPTPLRKDATNRPFRRPRICESSSYFVVFDTVFDLFTEPLVNWVGIGSFDIDFFHHLEAHAVVSLAECGNFTR